MVNKKLGFEVRTMGKMSSNLLSGRALKRAATGSAAIVLVSAVAACSADVTRFDTPPFGLTDSDSGPNQSPPASVYSRSDASHPAQPDAAVGRYAPPAGQLEPEIRSSALPEVQTSRQAAPAVQTADYSLEPAPAADAKASRNRAAPTLEKGRQVTVRQGDTLYGLSRSYGVPLSDLMAVNGLTGPNIKPGQALYLPAGASTATANVRAQTPAAVDTRTNAPSDWSGQYTVVPGDSLYKIARKYRTKSADLQRYNGIRDPRKVRPGTVLRVPGEGGGSGSSVAARQPARDISSSENRSLPPVINNTRTRVAGLATNKSAGEVPPRVVQSVTVTPPGAESGDPTKLRWPVRGKVVSNFGRRADGTHNDGVNVEVPVGTNVHAAEAGVVAYAGSELRGYGKLILLRHDNGWVTAYAHNDQMLVKRGDKIARGQVIAKSGKSGQVDRPQLHFELRQGSKPVDPLPYLAQL